MKKLLLILLCFPFIGFGQGWEKTFTNAAGYSVQQTTDGGFIIAGEINYNDAYLIKTDGSGNEQWNQTFGGSNYDAGYSVQQTSDGGFIIAGGTFSFGNGGQDVYLIKTDGSGNEQWNQTFGGSNFDAGNSVQQTTDGGFIIAGEKNNNAYLIKTDGSGNEQWNQTFGGSNVYAAGYSVQQTSDGGYIMAGRKDSDSYLGIGNGGRDVFLIKTDGNGNEQWNQTFGGTDDDYARSVQQTSDGGFIIAGVTYSFGNGEQDVYLIKTDGSGNEQWNQTFGGTDTDFGNSVKQTSDGGFIITGDKNHSVYLIKTDGNGNINSTFNIPANTNRKIEKTVDLLGRETKPQTNTPFMEIYDDGTVEKRIIIE